MESTGFNGTLLAQLFNFVVLLAIMGVIFYFLVKAFRSTSKVRREIDDLDHRLRNVERKIDKGS